MTGDNLAAIVPAKGSRLDVVAVETPTPGPGEILVRNYAVAVQPLDAKILLAGYDGAGAPAYPAVLGSSGAGTVEAIGVYVSGLAVGDRVVFDTRAYVDTDVNRREGAWQKLVIVAANTVAKVRRHG
jgi:NADPH:quinone reductase-like Zn-dependent oxidoreductase